MVEVVDVVVAVGMEKKLHIDRDKPVKIRLPLLVYGKRKKGREKREEFKADTMLATVIELQLTP